MKRQATARRRTTTNPKGRNKGVDSLSTTNGGSNIGSSYNNKNFKKIDYAEDPFHNDETPFCRLLVDLAEEIIPIHSIVVGQEQNNVQKKGVTEENHQDGSSCSTKMSSSVLDSDTKSGVTELIRSHLVKEWCQHVMKKDHDTVVKTTTENGNNECSKKQDPLSSFERESVPFKRQMKLLSQFIDQATINDKNNKCINEKDSFNSFLESVIEQQNQRVSFPNSLSSNNNNSNKRQHPVITNKGGISSRNNQASAALLPSAVTDPFSCHVHFSQVQDAVAAIACPHCRPEVRKVFLHDFRINVEKPLLHVYNDPSITTTTSPSTNDDAFDYVAMEEGNAPPVKQVIGDPKSNDDTEQLVFQLLHERNNSYEDATQVDEYSGWQLCRRTILPKSEKKSWTVSDVDFMIRNYVILAGYDPDLLNGSSKLSDNVIQSINASVDSHISENITTEFRNIAVELEKEVEIFVNQRYEDAKHEQYTLTSNSVNMKSYPIMSRTDDACCKALQRLLAIILDVTRSVQRILNYYVLAMNDSSANSVGPNEEDARNDIQKQCEWVIKPCLEMWKCFWDGISTCSDHVDLYETELMKGCDRLGNIPAIYLNLKSRQLYGELVESKIRLVHPLSNSIERILHAQTSIHDSFNIAAGVTTDNWSTTYIRKLFTVESYYQIAYQKSCECKNDTGMEHHPKLTCRNFDSELDGQCKDLLEFISLKLSGTLQSGTSHHLSTTRQEEILEMASKFEMIKNNRNSDSPIDVSASACTLLQNSIDQIITTIKTVACKEIKNKRSKIAQGMFHVGTEWILKSTNIESDSTTKRNSCSKQQLTVTLPLKLRRSMVNEPTTLSGGYESICQGHDGRLRAVGILVSIFIKNWLADRYKEWCARRAEEELLSALACEQKKSKNTITKCLPSDNTSSSLVGAKSSKKSKKKKGKKSIPDVLPVQDNSEDPLPIALDEIPIVTVRPNDVSVDDDAIKHVTSEPTIVHSNDDVPGKSISFDEPEVSNSREVSIASDPVPSSSSLQLDHSEVVNCLEEEEEITSEDDVEKHVNVLVHNESGYQTAEDFLVNRFLALITEG